MHNILSMTSNAYFKQKARELKVQQSNLLQPPVEQKLTLKSPNRTKHFMNTICEDFKQGSNKSKAPSHPPSVKNNKSLQRRCSVPTLTLNSSSLLEKASKDHGKVFSPNSIEDKRKFHVVILGSANVGKTAIIQKFFYNHFPHQYVPTVEDLHSRNFTLFGKELTVSVLDTAGAGAFPAMRELSLTNADGFILVYSIDNSKSWEDVKSIHEEVMKKRKPEKVPMVIVGNKSDLEESREVSNVQVEALVELTWNHAFLETSAKTKDVLDIFRELLNQANISFPLFTGDKSADSRLSVKRRSSVGLMNLSVLKSKSKDDSEISRSKSGNCKVQ